MIAGHIAMMDTLLDGRLIWGIGPGGLPSDIEAFEIKKLIVIKKWLKYSNK